jgi:phosphoglycerate dehydrogenase-like enzyme
MTLLLAMARRLPFMINAMRQGNWTARGNPEVHRIAGQTLGLIGFGRSAQAVARRAASFGLKLLGWARNPAKHQQAAASEAVELVLLERLLTESDFVSIHLPLTDETRHFLSAERLRLLKPTAVLINTSRGAIIDEAALIETLRQRRIGGAALDVFETIDVFASPGPPSSHPLLELDNVLATPHCAGSSVESTYESKLRGASHAADVLAGRWPPHIVNLGVVPRFPLAA